MHRSLIMGFDFYRGDIMGEEVQNENPGLAPVFNNLYGEYESQTARVLFPGGPNQIANIISSFAFICSATSSSWGESQFKDILSIYSEVRFRKQAMNDDDKTVVGRLMSKFRRYVKSQKTAERIVGFVRICSVSHNFTCLTPEALQMLDKVMESDAQVEKAIVKNNGLQDKNTDDNQYGIVKEKPVYTNGVDGTFAYLASLRTSSGQKLTWVKHGTSVVKDVVGAVDEYEGRLPSGEFYGIVYINMFCNANSTAAPFGFFIDGVEKPKEQEEKKEDQKEEQPLNNVRSVIPEFQVERPVAFDENEEEVREPSGGLFLGILIHLMLLICVGIFFIGVWYAFYERKALSYIYSLIASFAGAILALYWYELRDLVNERDYKIKRLNKIVNPSNREEVKAQIILVHKKCARRENAVAVKFLKAFVSVMLGATSVMGLIACLFGENYYFIIVCLLLGVIAFGWYFLWFVRGQSSTVVSPDNTIYCELCGATLVPNSRFCYRCGSRVVPQKKQTGNDESNNNDENSEVQ